MDLFGKLKNIADKVNDIINDDSNNSNYKNTVRNMGVLSTPPPPPIPVTKESMSVNVAVNGKSYGPYERATLLDMIANGSLTPQTLVFVKGMSGWKPAGEVPKVKELFNDMESVPDVPPVPWTQSTESTPSQPSTASSVEEENILSPRLNRLITMAVADGEITDMERQVLIRNAQEEGVAIDEFVMILEARLYEQRQVLWARQKEMEHKQNMEKISVQAAAAKVAAPPITTRENKTDSTKCPHCGAPRKALATTCPECGQDYMMATGYTAWEKLSAKIQEIQEKEVKRKWYEDSEDRIKTKKIINVINCWPVPTSKNEIVEFFTLCAPLGAKKRVVFGSATPGESDLAKAYKAKAQQVLLKAQIVLKDDPDLLSQIEKIAKQYKIK